MSTLQLRADLLKFGERRTIKTMIRASAGTTTVREAREFMSPKGRWLWINAIGAGLLTFGLAVILFAPLALLAGPVSIGVMYQAWRDRARWLTLLPPERDADFVEVV